jgi:hypothetical protein
MLNSISTYPNCLTHSTTTQKHPKHLQISSAHSIYLPNITKHLNNTRNTLHTISTPPNTSKHLPNTQNPYQTLQYTPTLKSTFKTLQHTSNTSKQTVTLPKHSKNISKHFKTLPKLPRISHSTNSHAISLCLFSISIFNFFHFQLAQLHPSSISTQLTTIYIVTTCLYSTDNDLYCHNLSLLN